MKKLLLIILVCVPCFAGWLPNWVAGGTARYRVESIRAPSGCASITAQSGGFASVASGGTGICTFTITTGIFSATPTCVCSAVDNANRTCAINTFTSATSFQTVTSSGDPLAATDLAVSVICMGAR